MSGSLQRNQSKGILSLILNTNRSKFLIRIKYQVKLSQVQKQQGHVQLERDFENEPPQTTRRKSPVHSKDVCKSRRAKSEYVRGEP